MEQRNINIFNDDCLNIIKKIPNESIDLIVTDPPYPTTSRGSAGNSGGMLQKEINKKGKYLLTITLTVLNTQQSFTEYLKMVAIVML